MAFSGSLLCAAPQGGQVRAGQAQITQQGKVTNINQSSQKAAINWQKFNIAADETVNFKQPNAHSVTLNRVIGNEKSVINGAMNANGKVFLLNPHGTLIGKGAKINVGGLVASTANISDDDFMQGKYRFTGNGSGAVENYGEIAVPAGGVVALLAPIVKNNGNIKADSASVLLASAEHFSITLPENGDFAYTIDKGTLQGLVDNGGAVLADGGVVVLTAAGLDSVKKSVVRHTGIIQANTVAKQNGKILLLGDLDNSRTEVSGSLKAEAPISGDGGFIETSANQVQIDDNAFVSTKAANGKTGEWLIDPTDYTVAASGGDMSGQAVSNALQNNNLTLKSTNSEADGKGDVIINDTINWNKNTLILNAQNDIHINKTINGSGSAKLALQYGQASADGGESNYYLDKDVQVNLPAGQNFSTQKGSAGEKVEFEVIHEMPEIVKNDDDIYSKYKSVFTTNNIAIGKDIDLSDTKNYQGFAGYSWGDKIYGVHQTNIAGLGHHLTNLSLSTEDGEVGLFRTIHESSLVNNLHLENVNIKGGSYVGGITSWLGRGSVVTNSSVSGNVAGDSDVGGLVGHMRQGTIKNSHTHGTVSGQYNKIGGLLGSSCCDSPNLIENSYSTANVTQTDENHNEEVSIGGLVGKYYGSGYSDVWDIKRSYATGDVTIKGQGSGAGGLVGSVINANITDSYATGNVTGNTYVGGLVGDLYEYGGLSYFERYHNTGKIANSYATGNVTGNYSVGGLAGTFRGDISNSYATGNVIGKNDSVGGLVGSFRSAVILDDETGERDGGIINSYATGDVTGVYSVGGLVGSGGFGDSTAESGIIRSYATGNVVGFSYVGGIAGNLSGSWMSDGRAGNIKLSQSYSSSNVSGEIYVGGLVGDLSPGYGSLIIENSYSTGIVKGLPTEQYLFGENKSQKLIGGLVGGVSGAYYDSDGGAEIKNSYFSGELVDTYGTAGAIIGGYNYEDMDDQPSKITITNTYYDKDKNAGYYGGKINGQTVGTGLTTAQMQDKNSFKGFDFDNVWTIKDGETPTLLAFNGSGTPTGGDNTGGDNQQQGGDNQQQGGDNQQQGGDNQQQGGDNQQQGGDNQQQGGDNQQQGGDNQQQGGDKQQQGGDNQQQGGDNQQQGGDNQQQDGDNQQQGGDNQQQGGDNTGGDIADGSKDCKNCNIPPKDVQDAGNISETEYLATIVLADDEREEREEEHQRDKDLTEKVVSQFTKPVVLHFHSSVSNNGYMEMLNSVFSGSVSSLSPITSILSTQLDVLDSALNKLQGTMFEKVLNGILHPENNLAFTTERDYQLTGWGFREGEISKYRNLINSFNDKNFDNFYPQLIKNLETGNENSVAFSALALSKVADRNVSNGLSILTIQEVEQLVQAFQQPFKLAEVLQHPVDSVKEAIDNGLFNGIVGYVEHKKALKALGNLQQNANNILATTNNQQDAKEKIVKEINDNSDIPKEIRKLIVETIENNVEQDMGNVIEHISVALIDHMNNDTTQLAAEFLASDSVSSTDKLTYISQMMIVEELQKKGVSLKGKEIFTIDKLSWYQWGEFKLKRVTVE